MINPTTFRGKVGNPEGGHRGQAEWRVLMSVGHGHGGAAEWRAEERPGVK